MDMTAMQEPGGPRERRHNTKQSTRRRVGSITHNIRTNHQTAAKAGDIMHTPASPSATAFSDSAPAPLSKAMVRRIVFSSSVGNALQWFDFLVYGYFASIIAKQFFPMHDEWLSTLLAIATFGISFLMRPLGAIVLGIYGDRKGRK